jgi:signal transduction histidine kinase
MISSMRRFALPTVLAIVLLLGVSLIVVTMRQNVQQIQTLLDETGAVVHTLEVQRQLDDILLTVIEAQTSQLSFMLTGQEGRLQRYTTAEASLTRQLRQLQALSSDNPAQVSRVDRLRDATSRQLAAIAKRVDARRARGASPNASLEQEPDETRVILAEIRRITSEMAEEEATVLASRQAQAEAAYEAAVTGRIGSAVVNALLFMSLALVAASWAGARERRARAQADERERQYREDARREEAAREVAEKANRSKDEFLAVLSHELRTPLNAVLGWAQILQAQGPHDATSNRGLASIKRNADALQRLVEDLLDVSRIVAGKFSMERRRIDARVPVSAAIESIRPTAQAKGVELQANLNGTVLLHADPDRLQQVASNLLSNAVKFTPTGGRIDASLTASNGSVLLCVHDTGEGMAKTLVPRIFDRFSQGNGTTTRSHGGLGLGLAIVKHIVDAHGGSIEASSDGEGRGSTFLIRLPVETPKEA